MNHCLIILLSVLYPCYPGVHHLPEPGGPLPGPPPPAGPPQPVHLPQSQEFTNNDNQISNMPINICHIAFDEPPSPPYHKNLSSPLSLSHKIGRHFGMQFFRSQRPNNTKLFLHSSTRCRKAFFREMIGLIR